MSSYDEGGVLSASCPGSFATKEDTIQWLLQYTVDLNVPHKVVRSAKDRYSVRCLKRECSFAFSSFRSVTGVFNVSKFVEHNCNLSSPRIRGKWVAKAIDGLAFEPSSSASVVARMLKTVYGVDLNPNTLSSILKRIRTRKEQSLVGTLGSTFPDGHGLESLPKRGRPPKFLTTSDGSGRGKILCSICHQGGHNKRRCPQSSSPFQ